jgi:hypothetical protein
MFIKGEHIFSPKNKNRLIWVDFELVTSKEMFHVAILKRRSIVSEVLKQILERERAKSFFHN